MVAVSGVKKRKAKAAPVEDGGANENGVEGDGDGEGKRKKRKDKGDKGERKEKKEKRHKVK